MFLTTISNYNGFARAIKLDTQAFDQKNKLIHTECTLIHYLNKLEIPEMNKIIIFTNDNRVQIPNGETIEVELPDGGTEIQNVLVGDYDYVEIRLENGDSIKSIFEDLIFYMDITNKINEKANYKF